MKKPLFLAIALCMVLAMGAPAQAAQSEMPTDGTYDIVVYTDGTTIIAKDSTGKVISSGTAGADDGKVVQAAVNAVGDGIVVLQAGTYALQSPIAIRVSNPAPAPTPTPTPGTPDLVVTEISWVPANPTPGDVITMKATIKNQGTGATPAGVIHGVAFTVDGNASSTVWSDNHVASIAPGGWVTVTANGGVAGATWTATAGTHTVRAHVDNVDRIKESNENNNVLTKTMTVRAAAPKPTPTPTATPTPTPTVPPNVEKPYKAHSIPGRINFADFDFGGEGIAYHDTEAGNQGGHSYRTDNADVDVGVRNGVSVPIVSHTYAGEWIRFSEVQVAESRTYAATFYASSTQDGRSFSVLVDGKKVATVEAPNTGDWHKFAPVTVQIPLTAGKHTVQITMDTGFADLAYVEFATVAPTPTPTATPTVTPTPTATATPKPTQTPSNNVYGAGANPTGNPIGGGDGYTNIVSRSSADFIVSTKSQLLSALQNARAGDIIYVEGNANIDMSGSLNVQIPAGVTLASNRGENGAPGGRIYQNRISNDQTSDWQPMFRTGGQNVRITGLRIEGPDKTTSSVSKTRIGILSTYRNLEVDNCEIWGWSGAGVNLYATAGSTMKAGGYVHHNNIHHCQMNGLGYGVLVSGGGTALIEANYLDYCRHAISGSGNANDGYEAQYNICGPNFIASYAFQFDMHGVASGSSTVAGDTIRIHHNTFTATGPVNAYPICIRGVPRNGAYIDHNWFYYTLDAPVWQTGGKTGISVTNNLIGSKGTLSTSGPIKFY